MDKTGLVILLLPALSTLSSGGSREYYYIRLLKTWSAAQSYCRENFADLATIETAEDWASVRRIMENADRVVWIGLYDDINSWRWSMDNTYLYSDGNTDLGEWFGFTNRGRGHCAELFGKRLYDRSCNDLLYSVCYDESTNTYIPVTVLMTWSSAQSYCREKYTDLTSIRNQQEKEAIVNVIDQAHWWIGLSRAIWQWSDQSNSSLRLWLSDEPNGDGRELCASTLVDGWADLSCGLERSFICSVPIVKLLKVVLKVEGSVDLNDPSLHEAVLNHIAKNMRNHGIQQTFRLSWRKPPNGKIFKRETEP